MKKRRVPRLHIAVAAVGIFFIIGAGAVYYNYKALENIDHDPTAQEAEAYEAALTAIASQAVPRSYHVASSTPQFIVLSFDGSKSTDMLNETLDFERTMAASGVPLKFTYFINAAYFLTQDTAGVYQAPGQ